MRPMPKMGPILLYVEDEESDRFLMQRAFAKAGIKDALQVVNDGQSAVDYLMGSTGYGDRENAPIPSPSIVGFEPA